MLFLVKIISLLSILSLILLVVIYPHMTLKQRISDKIKDIAPYLDSLPAVVIIHNIHSWNLLHMNIHGLKHLGVTLPELLDMGNDYHRRFFNPEESKEYIPKISGLLERNNNGEMVSFFQQVRPSENAPYKLWLSSTKVFMLGDDGKPLLTITVTVPVDAEHNISSKVDRLIDENTYLRTNKDSFASLTSREKEILCLMALDKSSAEIALQLYISEDTVKTHRRNIKRKINAKNLYDVVKFAQAFDML